MLIRIKRTIGNFGYVENGIVRPKNFKSGAFSVPDGVGEQLIARGIADRVQTDVPVSAIEEKVMPAAAPVLVTESPAPSDTNYAAMTIKELKNAARAAGIKGASSMNKAELIVALGEQETEEDAEDAPSLDVCLGVD